MCMLKLELENSLRCDGYSLELRSVCACVVLPHRASRTRACNAKRTKRMKRTKRTDARIVRNRWRESVRRPGSRRAWSGSSRGMTSTSSSFNRIRHALVTRALRSCFPCPCVHVPTWSRRPRSRDTCPFNVRFPPAQILVISVKPVVFESEPPDSQDTQLLESIHVPSAAVEASMGDSSSKRGSSSNGETAPQRETAVTRCCMPSRDATIRCIPSDFTCAVSLHFIMCRYTPLHTVPSGKRERTHKKRDSSDASDSAGNDSDYQKLKEKAWKLLKAEPRKTTQLWYKMYLTGGAADKGVRISTRDYIFESTMRSLDCDKVRGSPDCRACSARDRVVLCSRPSLHIARLHGPADGRRASGCGATPRTPQRRRRSASHRSTRSGRTGRRERSLRARATARSLARATAAVTRARARAAAIARSASTSTRTAATRARATARATATATTTSAARRPKVCPAPRATHARRTAACAASPASASRLFT